MSEKRRGVDMKSNLRTWLLTVMAGCCGWGAVGQGDAAHEPMPDTWAFTDGLGRQSLSYEEVGGPKADRTLALFYWTWHVSQGHQPPQNNQQVLDAHPEALNDFDHPAWKTGVKNFWDEPIYGYYITNDPWVLRRQGELLANAGVDAIFTDNTNADWTWKNSYDPLFETWLKAMADGVHPPKVSFMLPFGPGGHANSQIKSLYEDIYEPGKYRPLWFMWEGKPMLMAHPDHLKEDNPQEKALRDYFTYRRNYPGYVNPSPQLGNWGWLSTCPQAVYYADEASQAAGRPEQTTVGVAVNHDTVLNWLAAMNGRNIIGRSYTTTGYHREPGAVLHGYNFAEQFDFALKTAPRVIFVTGWNEWIAGRYKEWPEGHKTSVPNAFPDECNDEFSRDLEPSRGALKDHYYYQFVNYVRRYKGVRPVPLASGRKTIDLDGPMAQWEEVGPYFAAYRGNTGWRDADGYATCHYTDFSGRNDIVGAKVARDDSTFYFLVECATDITPHTDPLWMNLYIHCPGDRPGWNSFHYVVNKTAPDATHAIVERFTGTGYESVAVARVPYRRNGRFLTMAIPKSALAMEGEEELDFAWTDHVHDADDSGVRLEDGRWQYRRFSGDLMEFYVSGDVAPGGRFRFRYRVR